MAKAPDPASTLISIDDLLVTTGVTSLGENSKSSAIEAALVKLRAAAHGIDPLRRVILRDASIKALSDVSFRSPAAMVDAALDVAENTASSGTSAALLVLSDPEPWPDSIDGSALLNDLAACYTRFVQLPDGGATSLALWTLHAHVHAGAVSPILVLKSPTKRSGKTTTLTVLSALVPRPLMASNVTPAAIFRTVDMHRPTLLIDEADSFLTDNEEIRGILNSGHTRSGAVVVRTVGDDHDPRTFSTWCPKAVALIGNLHGTLEDRGIVLEMRRRAPTEKVERLRLDRLSEFEPLRRKAARWAADQRDALQGADPAVSSQLHDRAADNWRPLLAIADACGGKWPDDARRAALLLSGVTAETDTTPAIQLLADLRQMFKEHAVTRLGSDDIVRELGQREDRPWSEWSRGKPITVRQIAKLLRPFGVVPRQKWIEAENHRGYERGDLEDAFDRYLPPEPLDPLELKPGADSSACAQPLEAPDLAIPRSAGEPHEQGRLADLAVQSADRWKE
jgi:putative DNA primase/helicase